MLNRRRWGLFGWGRGTITIGLKDGLEPSVADQGKGIGHPHRRPLAADGHIAIQYES